MVRKQENKIKMPLIAQGDDFLMLFEEFLSEEKYRQVREHLTERIYTTSDTKESYRAINSWSEAGLLLEPKNRENGWRKFNMVELWWLRIIKELRAVGFGLDKIAVLRECIFNSPFSQKRDDTSLFEFYLLNTLSKKDVFLVVTSNGEGMFAFEHEYQRTQILLPLPVAHLLISLNKIHAEMTGKSEHGKSEKTPSVSLDNKELELISKIRSKDISQATLKIKENKIQRISYETLVTNPENTIEHIRQLLKESGHREITIYQEGKRGYQIKRVDKT